MSNWLLSFDATRPWSEPQSHGVEVVTRGELTVALHGWLHETNLEAIARNVELSGTSALQTLRGTFVIAICDAARHEVVIARDQLGSHPLFVARAGTRLVFGESTLRLRQVPGVARDLNRVALADHLCHRWPSRTETFFTAIERIPPGCWARLTPGAMRTERYWDPAPADQPVRWIGEDAPNRFTELFDRAIDRCLGNGPSAIFLSGGLDSISVAATAGDRARALGQPAPWALSLAMPDPSCDEREVQTLVAQSLGLRQHLVEFNEAVGRRGLIQEAVGIGRSLSSPVLNVWAPAYLSLAALAGRDGVRTILSGSGGDEWLSVSPYLSADLLARGDLSGWWQFFQAFRRSYRHPLSRHLSLTAWTFGARPLASRLASRLLPRAWPARRQIRVTRHDPGWVAPDTELRSQQRQRAFGSLEDADPAQGFYLREVRSGLEHPLTSWELEEQYEFGNRTGQRFAHPYWDADLVDMLYRTPPAVLMAGGRAKGLIRGSLAHRLPSAGLGQQRKVPGTGFYRFLVNRDLPQAAVEVGTCRELARLGVITDAAARDYGTEAFGTPTNRWDVINLETWVRANS